MYDKGPLQLVKGGDCFGIVALSNELIDRRPEEAIETLGVLHHQEVATPT